MTDDKRTKLAALHNQIVGDIVKSIVKPPFAAGGDYRDALVVLESVIVGVLRAGVKSGGDEAVLEALTHNVRERLAQLRLAAAKPEGNA